MVLQKATELGVSAVWPVLTERSVARPKPEAFGTRHARWQRIAEEAARQSGRAEVPEVTALRSLEEAARALGAGDAPARSSTRRSTASGSATRSG